jgi:carbon storage regulator
MLVLSRKVGEKLVIDGNITVEVVKILRGELTQKPAKSEATGLVVEDGLLVAC